MAVKPYAEDLGPFWVGDNNQGAITQVDFLDDSGMVTTAPVGALTATLTAPAGSTTAPAGSTTTATLTVTQDLDVDFVDVTWAEATAFDQPGVWTLTIHPVIGSRFAPLRFVVQDDDGWNSIDDAREDWADAPTRDATLFRLLESARTACEYYAPEPDPLNPLPVPAGYRTAQLMQARAVWNAVKAGGEDQLGADGLTVRVFPLDWNVKALLRPKRGRPVIR